MIQPSLKKTFIQSACVIFFYFLFILIRTACILRLPLQDVVYKFFRNFYFPHVNFFTPGYIGGVNINLYFYELILFSTLIVIALQKIIFRKTDRANYINVLLVVSCGVYALIAGCQSINQVAHVRKIRHILGGKTLDERHAEIFGEAYRYVKEVKKILPGKHSAEMITSLDISQDPGMFTQRVLSYFLYPIDLRGIRREPADCLIVYMKDQAAENVPPEYQILSVFDDRNLVAVKRDIDLVP